MANVLELWGGGGGGVDQDTRAPSCIPYISYSGFPDRFVCKTMGGGRGGGQLRKEKDVHVCMYIQFQIYLNKIDLG